MTARFAITAPQLRFMLAVETLGRMSVDGPDASKHSIATRRAVRNAGWVRQVGTLGSFAWEITEAGAFQLAEWRREMQRSAA